MKADPRQIAYRALALAPSPRARYQRNGGFLERDGVTYVRWDSPDPTNRFVAVFGSAPAWEEIVPVAADFFGSASSGWAVLLDGSARHPLEAILRQHGWTVAQDEPGMVLAPIPARPALPSGLEIRRVRTQSDLQDYYAASAASFVPEDPANPKPEEVDLTQAFLPSLGAVLDADIAVFAGYSGSNVVATAGMERVEGTAAIFGISVVPAYRRRGFGAAMTWAAITEGAARGCQVAALSASPMGFPVYQRMGFREVCLFRTYVPPAPGVAHLP